MFSLKPIDNLKAIAQVSKGKMHTIREPEKTTEEEDGDSVGSGSDGDGLERQLDSMYEEYQERKMSHDAKYRVKKSRAERDDDDWEGFSHDGDENAPGSDSSDDVISEDEQSDLTEDIEDARLPSTLLQDLDLKDNITKGLSKRASLFF